MSEHNDDVRRYEAARAESDLSSALELAKGIAEKTAKEQREALLRLARTHALLGRREDALLTLWEAVDAGFWDVDSLREDETFTEFREDPVFKSIVRASWTKGYLSMLEREERESFQRKSEVLRVLDFRPGERVADLGAGSGYFTIPIARAIGPDGVVWAIDIFQQMLDFIERRIAIERLPNVRLYKTLREDLRLPEGDLDTILMSDMLHYVQDRVPLLRGLKEYLRPGGRMAVLDFTPKSMEERPWGPSPDQQVSQTVLEEEMRLAGMKLRESYDFLPEQHFTIFGLE